MNKHKKGCRKDSLFCLRRSTATAAKDDDCDKDDDPAIIVAEERIKAAHNIASLHYIVHIMWEGEVLLIYSAWYFGL